MNRELHVERTYPTGNYANIKFGHVLRDIPDAIALDNQAMKQLEYILILDVEYAYRRYVKLMEHIAHGSTEDVLAFIENEQEETFTQLLTKIQGD